MFPHSIPFTVILKPHRNNSHTKSVPLRNSRSPLGKKRPWFVEPFFYEYVTREDFELDVWSLNQCFLTMPQVAQLRIDREVWLVILIDASGSERRLKKAGGVCVCSLSHNQLHSIAMVFCDYKARAPFHKLKEESIFFKKFYRGSGATFFARQSPGPSSISFSLSHKRSATLPEKSWKTQWQGDRIKRLGKLSPVLAD